MKFQLFYHFFDNISQIILKKLEAEKFLSAEVNEKMDSGAVKWEK
jgi:hypothetical protein